MLDKDFFLNIEKFASATKLNGSFRYVPVENISKEILELIETILIGFFKPELNDSKKNINVKEVDSMPTKTEVCNLK